MDKLTSEKIGRVYSRKDIFEELRGIVDVTEREISYWMDLEIVVPDIANPKGQGKTRYHSIYNLIDFALAKKMSLAGMNLATVKVVMKYLQTYDRAGLYRSAADLRLIVTDPNTENMKVYFEGTEPLPADDLDTMINRAVNNMAIREWGREINRNLVMVGKFESMFVLNITSTVKKVLGITA